MKNFRCVLAQCVLPGLLLMSFFSACSTPQKRLANRSRDHAFIVYWPPSENSKQLRLAVKDLIDMKGVVTTAGSEYVAKTSPPASQDAKCLELARERNVQIVGKTNLTEFAVTVSGKNGYFGTPRNRLDGKHEFIPGGSSSGSAVAVETGMADVAFGTDTGGSIRLPAACCGICGLKTTFGLVPIKGVFPISPKHLDTVGPMAKDMAHLVQGMDLLQRGFAARYERAVAAKPSAKDIRIGRLYIDGTDPAIDKALDDALAAKHFKVIKLDQAFKAKWDQAQKDGKAVAFADIWLNDQKYTDKNGVSGTTKTVINQGERDYTNNYKDALKRQAAWQHDLRKVFKKVDFIALPTLQNLPPKFPFFGSSVVFELLVFNMQNTAGVNFAGNPALAMPIPMPVKGKTVPATSLQLVGRRLSEAELLNAGRLIESKH
jgi:Asp-tRNA(Asn)/Glu-tRNA(Gln) amidotransferase A subunit family amidase